MKRDALVALCGHILNEKTQHQRGFTIQIEPLQADGSSRQFYRLRGFHAPLLAILPPAEPSEKEMAEAASVYHIGAHLQKCGAATPKIYGWEQKSGLVCMEDLGDLRLYGYGLAHANEHKTRVRAYEKTVQALARMQVRTAQGFNPAWCWDTPLYDERLMRERESDYFLRAFCSDLLGMSYDREAIQQECHKLAKDAAQAPAVYFLHRDFQSRNVMLTPDGVPHFIDFQGGRIGPLAYDLASLLLDPYANLPKDMQEHLKKVYLQALLQETGYDIKQFHQEYQLLALQRNMQILGAFAFLSQKRHKPFFTRFLSPALQSLLGMLAKHEADEYAGLRHLCQQCAKILAYHP